MSRNLCTSYCCDNLVRLSDLRGKPIEFRRYYSEPVVIGTKWVCPTCQTAYFAWWRDAIKSDRGDTIRGFVIDLSYYDSFDDELPTTAVDRPWYLCLENAEDNQEVWGRSKSEMSED